MPNALHFFYDYHKKYIDFYKIIEYYLSEGGKNEKKFNS